MNQILIDDLEYINNALKPHKEKFLGSKILITGCAGFLGFYLLNYFLRYSEELKIELIIGIDNFLLNKPKWINELKESYPNILKMESVDICQLNLEKFEEAKDVNYVIHAASIASPTFYRKYPLKTIEANIWGLKNLLNFYKSVQTLKGFLFFSSSEVYGDPSHQFIPTSEEYNGNVCIVGPRSCYDESKRFGETVCYVYNKQFNMPITIVRPFNNYGPGMNINDKRVPADFAKSVMTKKDIVLLSDGSPTRTFCYISDAIIGYLLGLLYGEFDTFNIGTEKPEISILELAKIYQKVSKVILGFHPKVKYMVSDDKDYMKDNPNRRCPNIKKANKKLGYIPNINIEEGVRRYLEFLSKEMYNIKR